LARFNVREATLEDEELLLRKSKEMVAESPRFKDCKFNDAKATAKSLERIEAGGWFISEEDGVFTGMICGELGEEWFGDDILACDLFLYVAPEFRGGLSLFLLVKEFEKWAWAKGAKSIDLGVMTDIHPEKTIKAYTKLGYEVKTYGCTKDRDDRGDTKWVIG
jgi:GNAT superfamily N-acetyltransferase